MRIRKGGNLVDILKALSEYELEPVRKEIYRIGLNTTGIIIRAKDVQVPDREHRRDVFLRLASGLEGERVRCWEYDKRKTADKYYAAYSRAIKTLLGHGFIRIVSDHGKQTHSARYRITHKGKEQLSKWEH